VTDRDFLKRREAFEEVPFSFLSTSFPERAGPRGPFLEAEPHAEIAALELQYHSYRDVPWP